jgi:glycine dehydrogenase subunit 2
MPDDRTIFEKSRPGRSSFSLQKSAADGEALSHIPVSWLRREQADLPEVSERDIIAHYMNLSKKNLSVDTHFYPLGSCTMKYNPKVSEALAASPAFRGLHPMQAEEDIQGLLRLMRDFEKILCRLFGFDAFTLQPAAGAHGELTALMIARQYFLGRGENGRRVVLVPDSSHGTNPASAFMCGFDSVVTVRSGKDGEVDLSDLKEKCTPDVACLMVTNPNTLGLFETRIREIAEIVHDRGALLYGDGANMNALMGMARPGDMGFDFIHINLHKTFAAPHGGGGPGSGPVGVKKALEPYLPVPVVRENSGLLSLEWNREKSIGAVRAFYGNLSVIVKAFAYALALGDAGLRKASQLAVLNARYLMQRLKKTYPLPYDRPCMHEFVLSVKPNSNDVHTSDIGKALVDSGYHPPTVYFPLIVKDAIMIEPTETESPETLDAFAEAMERIARDIDESPGKLKAAPATTPVRRLDEVAAARNPVVNWFQKDQASESKAQTSDRKARPGDRPSGFCS